MVPTTDPKKKKDKKPAYTVKSLLNPKNWGVSDYSDRENFSQAFGDAKRDEKKEFMFEGSRYNTKSDTTPQAQLSKYGITDKQREGKTMFSERLYKSIKPDDYGEEEFGIKLKDFLAGNDRFDPEHIQGRQDRYEQESKKVDDLYKKSAQLHLENPEMSSELGKKANKMGDAASKLMSNLGEDDPQSEDGWRMYLGMPQKNSTFGVSKHKPSKSKGEDSLYYSLPQAFKDNFLDSYKSGQFLVDEEATSEGINERSLTGAGDASGRVLGNFTAGRGKDEKGEYISYYDKYDLHPTSDSMAGQFDADKLTGKPFEIYDRIYLNDKPTKAKGGVLKGPSHEQGGIDAVMGGKVVANVEGGERLLSVKDTALVDRLVEELSQKPTKKKAATLGKKVAKIVKTQDAAETARKFNTFATDPGGDENYIEKYR